MNSVPLFSPYCGYAYFLDGHYWYFDFRKPYTYLYTKINITLQVFCVSTMIIIDVLIVYKVCKLQKAQSWKPSVASINEGRTSYFKKKPGISRETRIALNFVVLTMCFLAMTLCFNLVAGGGVWQDALIKLSANLNLAKWAIYLLGNTAVRQRVRHVIGISESYDLQAPSVLTRTN
ncbi:hypothetical protein OESDEN_15131 [Oesophagostomum dentatum]|uniref:7TM GPCR serpentine receptor class x (Srx) domain-containing protein n=1 Tax=Oesophagostomum dentatum TaxID=61180 RepID=A0A0B1SNT8_OESDE|nr:hypothetical protein OESDEN_15131 [Oesophagostomum dentatum]